MAGVLTSLGLPVPLKGLNIAKDWTQLDPDEASFLRNVDVSSRQCLRSRPGITTVTYAAGVVEGVIPEFCIAPSGAQYLVLFRSAGGGTYLDYLDLTHFPVVTSASIGLTNTVGGEWGGVVDNGILYFGNGIDPISTFNLTTKAVAVLETNSGIAPRGNIFAEYKGRLMCSDPAYPTTLFGSAVGDPTLWDPQTTGDDAIEEPVGAFDGHRILGLRKMTDDGVLRIFRSDGQVYSFELLENGLNTVRNAGVRMPCKSRYAIVQTESDIFTFGDDGVYSYGQQANYFGGDRPGEVSSSIAPIWDPSRPNPNVGYNVEDIENAVGTYWMGKLLFSCKTSQHQEKDVTLCYVPTRGAWCEWTGSRLLPKFYVYDRVNDELYFLRENSSSVLLSKFGGSSDDGTAIAFASHSGKLEPNVPKRTMLRYIDLKASMVPGTSMNVEVVKDGALRGTSFPVTWAPLSTGGVTLTSLTSVSTTATATKAAHGFVTGQYVLIAGAEAEYNGIYQITVPNANEFTYMFAGSSHIPASGTIVATLVLGPNGYDGVGFDIVGDALAGASQALVNIDKPLTMLINGKFLRIKITASLTTPLEVYDVTGVVAGHSWRAIKYHTATTLNSGLTT